MTQKPGPKHRADLRNNYLASAGVAVLLLLSGCASAQVLPPPVNSPGLRATRLIPDSTGYVITGCGVPTDTTFLHVTGFKNATNRAAEYYDSCGHHDYIWDPSLRAWQLSGSGGSGNGFSMRTAVSSNFSTAVNCPLPSLNNDSLQIFWNDLGRFLVEGTEWQNLSGGGFRILVPGFDATANSYTLTVYANNVAAPPGPENFTSSAFTSSTNCPITAFNGMTLSIFWNDAARYLVQGTDWTPLTGGGFTITISGFNATTTNYSFYVTAQ